MMWWAVVLGAAIGAPSRYFADLGVARLLGRHGPWGTVLINLSGSAILGAAAGLVARGHLTALGYALVGTGFCGSFTTFSTFVWETFALVEERRFQMAWTNVLLTLTLGIGLAYATYEVVRH